MICLTKNAETEAIEDLAEQLLQAKEEVEAAEAAAVDARKRYEKLDQTLAQRMALAEIESIRVHGYNLTLRTQTYVSVRAGAMDTLCAWLRTTQPDLIKESVHPNTLKAWVKEVRKERGDLPPEVAELLHVYDKFTVGIRTA